MLKLPDVNSLHPAGHPSSPTNRLSVSPADVFGLALVRQPFYAVNYSVPKEIWNDLRMGVGSAHAVVWHPLHEPSYFSCR